MICIICEKQIRCLKDMNTNPDGAGTLSVHFGYGSNHDQLGAHGYMPDEEVTELIKLLRADLIRGYICDDCFEHKLHCFEGYKKRETVKWIPISSPIINAHEETQDDDYLDLGAGG